MSKRQDPFQIVDNGKKGIIVANKEFFKRDAVLTVANKFTKNYFVGIQPLGEREVQITIYPKTVSTISENLLKEFMNELIDQQIRIDLQNEFGELRNKIIEYAFSSVSK